MTQKNRIKGGLIDRSKEIKFRFNDKWFRGHPGDTLASALLANGQLLMGRSFKYHRPRGVFTDGSEEPNALVHLRDGAYQEPNTRATMVELFDGLNATSQNHRGSLEYDLLAANDFFSPFLSAGFYYKTFMWPKAFWEKLYEPVIRSAAGLGRLSMKDDPETDVDETGQYWIQDLLPGSYWVAEVPVGGWDQTFPDEFSLNRHMIGLQENEIATSVDFGNRESDGDGGDDKRRPGDCNVDGIVVIQATVYPFG